MISQISSKYSISFQKSWLQSHKLIQTELAQDAPIIPIIKFHPSSLSKFFPYEKCDLSAIFQNLIDELQKTLILDGSNLEIDLRFFGKIIKTHNQIAFVPPSSLRAKLYQGFDVQTLQKFSLGKSAFKKQTVLPEIRGKDLEVNRPIEVLVSQDNTNYEKKNPRNIRTMTKKVGNQENKFKAHDNQSFRKAENAFNLAKEQHMEEMKKLKQDSVETFGFDKSKYFSQKYKTPAEIWDHNYLRPNHESNELPIILEKHSQTKAKPATLMFNSLSTSSRIAINYTPLAKYIYLDPSVKRITILHNNENNGGFHKEKNNFKEEEEGAESVKSNIDDCSEDQSFQASEVEVEAYNRHQKYQNIFMGYVNTLIKEEEVIDFSPKLLENLRENAKKNLNEFSSEEAKEFLCQIFKEINNDFKISLKKGILQYIFKDAEERRRLELPYLPEKPEEYGSIKNFKLSARGNRGAITSLKVYLKDNLMLFSADTNRILDCWNVFENESLFNLTIPENGIEVNDFIEQQRQNIIRIRAILTSTWIKKISDIYKSRAKNFKKKQLRIFFDTMGIVISGQVRQLIEKSLAQIHDFFNIFSQTESISLEDSFNRYNSPIQPLQKNFLIMNLKEKDNALVFESDIDSIIEDMVEVIKDAVKCSENVARPENFFQVVEKNNLDSVSLDEPIVQQTIEQVRSTVLQNFKKISNFDFIFKEFYYFFEEKNVLMKNIEAGIDQDGLLVLYKKYTALEGENVANFPAEVPFNMLKLNAGAIKEQIVAIPYELRHLIEDHVYREIESMSTSIVKTLKNNFESQTARIDTVEKLIEKENWLDNFKTKDFPALQANYLEVLKWYEKFSPYIRFSFERLKYIFEAKEQILEYCLKIEKEGNRIKSERETLEKRLIGRKGVVNSKAVELGNKVEAYRREGKAFWIEKMLTDIAEARSNLVSITKDIELINREEELMGYPKCEFENVNQSATSITLFEAFWNNISEWTLEHDKWEKTIIFKLDTEKVIERSAAIHKNLSKLLEELTSFKVAGPEPIALGERTLSAIENFQKDFELVGYFCNEGLSQRHWIEINKYLLEHKIEVKLEAGGTYYISTLKDLNLSHLQPGIAEISATATKEWENEKFLRQVEEEFENANLELVEYRSQNEMFILPAKFAEETVLSIGNSLLRIEMMVGSPYAAVFRDKITELQHILTTTKNVLRLWTALQSQWIYLEPVFNTDDIVKSLPQESMRFKEAQVGFRSFVLARKREPFLRGLASDLELTGKLTNLTEMLEKVDQNLENYLDKKRNDFPRLYFLSSASLIEMIANVKTPAKLDRQIRNLFGGVKSIKVNSNDEIEGIVSFEGEVLLFTQKIYIRAFKGHIERWLASLEETIAYEVKKVLITSLQDFAKVERESFMLGRLSQIALNVIMTAWTYETEHTITGLGYNGLRESLSELNKFIKSVVENVSKDISPAEMITVEGVISRCVHNKSILEHLIENRIEKISDYCWESQLRYYWEQNNVAENSASKIQMMYATFYYGYEYIGCGDRFILTPLTDRCFRSFFTATQMFFGNCLEGPSATGKTETIKEFARVTARFLFLLNCSPQFDCQTAVRLLKGVAISGAWACFDEFNRVEMDVLSAFAQQFQRIQTALNQGRQEFIFNGSMLKFKGGCNIFVTANSGFTNTIKLPENVKYLFRSIVVVQPDWQLIIESRLFSAGFEKAESIALKITGIFEFCKGLFKGHSRHDFTLRSMISVIKEAFGLKKANPEGSECILIIEALILTIGPKFALNEFKQFREIIQAHLGKENMQKYQTEADLQAEKFQNIEDLQKINESYKIQPKEHDIEGKIIEETPLESAKENKKTPELLKDEIFVTEANKHMQHFEINKVLTSRISAIKCVLGVNHGVLLLGESMSGKTKTLQLYAELEGKIDIIRIAQNSMTIPELLGRFDNSEWSIGVLQSVFNKVRDSSQNTLVVFDGHIHPSWVESLNTLLDESKKLSLANGDILHLPDNMNIVFETDNVRDASPATLSRLGLIYFDIKTFGWKNMMRGWVTSLAFFSSVEHEKIFIFFAGIYESILKATASMEFKVHLSECQVFRTFTVIAQKFLLEFQDMEENNSLDAKDKLALIDQVLIFSLIWSLGSLVADSHVKAFDLAIKKASKTPDKSTPNEVWKQFRKVTLPESGSVFDQRLVFTKEKSKLDVQWKPWLAQTLEEYEIPPEMTGLSEIVPLAEHTRYLIIAKQFLDMRQNVIIAGRVGTGKSTIMSLIKNQMESQSNLIIDTLFQKSTTSAGLSTIFNKNTTRKMKETIYFPINEKEKLTFYIEDLNLGEKLDSGVIVTGEILRFLNETERFFDFEGENKEIKQISNHQIVGTVTLMEKQPEVTARALSGFCLLTMHELEEESLTQIFAIVANHHFNDGFNPAILKKIPKITSASIDIVKECRKRFASHGTTLFTVRDVFRLLEGLRCCDMASFSTIEEFGKFWIYESWLVLGDALKDQTEKEAFLAEILKPVYLKHFGTNFEVTIGNHDHDINNPTKLSLHLNKQTYSFYGNTDFNPRGIFSEVTNKAKLTTYLEVMLDKMNEELEIKIELPLYGKIIENIMKLSHLISKEISSLIFLEKNEENFKKTLRFATWLNKAHITMLSELNWKDMILQTIISAGAGNHSVLYIKELFLKNNEITDFINALLNNKNVLAFLNAEQIEKIKNANEKSLELNQISLNIRRNLHIVMYSSPFNNNFEKLKVERPSLVDCCQVCFSEDWLEEVLRSIASAELNRVLTTNIDKVRTENVLVAMHKEMHEIYEKYSMEHNVRFKNNSQRFDELLENYFFCQKSIFVKRESKINLYENGLNMLNEYEEVIQKQQEIMEEFKPIMEEAKRQISSLMDSIEEKTELVNLKKEKVVAEEEVIKTETEKVRLITEECQFEINIIQPELDRAREEIMRISKTDLDELKQMKNPPLAVQFAMQSLCLLLNIKAELKRDPVTGRNNPDWWATSRLLLNSLSVDRLVNFDNMTDVDDAIFKKLESFLEDPRTKEYLEENSIRFSSPTACSLFLWVTGQMNLFSLNLTLAPKREELENANKKTMELEKICEEKKNDLNEVQTALNSLKEQLAVCRAEKEMKELEIENLIKKSDFAQRILNIIPDEKNQWKDTIDRLKEEFLFTEAEVFLTAGYLTYFGILDFGLRKEAFDCFKSILETNGLILETFKDPENFGDILNPSQIKEWVFLGLPNHTFSIDNAILIENSKKTIICLDPHSQAKKPLEVLFKQNNTVFLNLSDPNLNLIVQKAIMSGTALCIEDIILPLPPLIECLIQPKIIDNEDGIFIEWNNKKLPFHREFRLVLLSHEKGFDNVKDDANRFSIINFEVTTPGLANQIIQQLMLNEKPDLEKQFEECLSDNYTNSVELEKVQIQILKVISKENAKDLDDTSTIELLIESKDITQNCREKQIQLIETNAEITLTRSEFLPLANRLAEIFIVAAKFKKINPFYQISVENFLDCLNSVTQNKQNTRVLSQRVHYLQTMFLKQFSRLCCRGIFNQDKLLFVASLLFSLETQSTPDSKLFDYLFLTPDLTNMYVSPNSEYPWVTEKQWINLHYLGSCYDKFKDLCFDPDILRELTYLMSPENKEWNEVPNAFTDDFQNLETFCLLKAMHPDKLRFLLEDYIKTQIGREHFSEIFAEDFNQLVSEASLTRPILIMLKEAQDSYAFLQKNAPQGVSVENALVGREQTNALIRVLEDSIKNGNWLLLQIFGPMPSVWESLLQKINIIKGAEIDASKNFCLFISCSNSSDVPSIILRNSKHLALENPPDLKKALQTVLADDLLNNQEFHDSCDKKKLLQQISMLLCFFHAVLQERTRIGLGGFGQTYTFLSSDFKITLQQIQILLSKLGDDFSLDIIKKFILECNYGAKMICFEDHQLLESLVNAYINQENLKQSQIRLNPDNAYSEYILQDLNHRSKAVEFANNLSDENVLNLLGIEPEKQLQNNLAYHNNFDKNIGLLFNKKKEKVLEGKGIDISKLMNLLQKLPPLLDLAAMAKRLPIAGSCINVLLNTEIEKLNSVLTRIKSDLEICTKVSSGNVIASPEIEAMLQDIISGKVPKNWTFWSFGECLKIDEFFEALVISMQFFQQVINIGKLSNTIILKAFSMPKILIQALKMNYAAEQGLSVEDIQMSFSPVSEEELFNKQNNTFFFSGFKMVYGEYDFGQEKLCKTKESENESLCISLKLGSHSLNEKKLFYDCPVYAKQELTNTDSPSVKFHDYMFSVPLTIDCNPESWVRSGTKIFLFKS